MTAELHTGDLIATHSSGLVGELIRFGEKRAALGWRRALWHSLTRQIDTPDDPWYFNHIAVYVGAGQIIEAQAKGLSQPSQGLAKYTEYRVLPLAKVLHSPQPDEIKSLERFAQAEYALREPYGWLSILSIVLNMLTPAKLEMSWGGALICSAFGARCWEHAGATLPFDCPLTITPANLVMIAK